MELYITDSLNLRQKQQIIAIWNAEYPADLALKDLRAFDTYLNGLSDKTHLLLEMDGRVAGWLVHFFRDGEQCFVMLLDAAVQGKGLGSRLLEEAKKDTRELVGWIIDTETYAKTDGSTYRTPVGFYLKNGFRILPNIRLKKNHISGIKVKWLQSNPP